MSTTTDCVSFDYEEDEPAASAEYTVGYNEKVQALADNLDQMYKFGRVRWLKKARECRPVSQRPLLGFHGPWSA